MSIGHTITTRACLHGPRIWSWVWSYSSRESTLISSNMMTVLRFSGSIDGKAALRNPSMTGSPEMPGIMWIWDIKRPRVLLEGSGHLQNTKHDISRGQKASHPWSRRVWTVNIHGALKSYHMTSGESLTPGDQLLDKDYFGTLWPM